MELWHKWLKVFLRNIKLINEWRKFSKVAQTNLSIIQAMKLFFVTLHGLYVHCGDKNVAAYINSG